MDLYIRTIILRRMNEAIIPVSMTAIAEYAATVVVLGSE